MQDRTLLRDILLGAVAIGITGFVGATIAPITQPQVEVREVGLSSKMQERLDKSAATSLFGQFRSSIADFLWLKVDKYLHNGVELRGLTKQEQEKQNADLVRTSAKDVASGYKQHAEETTTVPSERNDWRGILGNVEREVQPYQDMSNHTHNDPKEALPLFRLMTTANPKFIPGYVYGASMIARDRTKFKEALAFLREGEGNNPNSLEIKTEIGLFYESKYRDFVSAELPSKEALAIAVQRDPKSLTEEEKEAWQNAYRCLVLSYRYRGKRAEAHQTAITGLKLFPEDATCRKQLEIEKAGEWSKYEDAVSK